MSKPSHTVYTKDFANMICRRLERENKNLQKQIDKLQAEIRLLEDNRNYLNDRIDKALYWLSENTHYTSLKVDKLIQDENTNFLELLKILKGEDK